MYFSWYFSLLPNILSEQGSIPHTHTHTYGKFRNLLRRPYVMIYTSYFTTSLYFSWYFSLLPNILSEQGSIPHTHTQTQYRKFRSLLRRPYVIIYTSYFTTSMYFSWCFSLLPGILSEQGSIPHTHVWKIS